MSCQCKCDKCDFYLNLWFKITNRLAYYGGIAVSSCSSECAKEVAKQYIAVLEFQLSKVEAILTELKCVGFNTIVSEGMPVRTRDKANVVTTKGGK